MHRRQQTSLWQHIRPQRISSKSLRFKATFCLGGLSFLSFLILLGTGMLLLFNYQPGEKAYSSLVEINSVLPYGALIRSLHFWAGQFMVISIFLHMVRVVVSHAYRPPRELNWVIGVLLLGLTLIMDYSGYLLRGDQEGGAAASVGKSLLQVIPGGKALSFIFFGNPSPLNSSTLHLYIWHSFVLAWVISVLQMYHFWRIRRNGGIRSL